MQYSLLTEVWGPNFQENKNIINAGQYNSLDDVAKNVHSTITGADTEQKKNQNKKINEINAPNNPQPNKVVLINPNDIQYGGSVIKNDNYILLGLLLLFIADTFYNL
tara:strand:+ start:212 stop:532 length:321 start_codon:yes stop_codon:yes gene_type:complete